MPPSFFALEFHSEFEYRYAAVRINSGDDSTTLCKKFGELRFSNSGDYEARMYTSDFPRG